MKLSIITINLNNKAGLLRTFASVESQVDRQFEHVIVDGASTDDSVEVIKEYAERHDNVRWISEPDTGIYNAMNKAARMATADYILYINSGDELYASDVVQKFNELECDEDLVLGEIVFINNNTTSQKKAEYNLIDSKLSFLSIYTEGIPHPATFIKREFQITSPYDETYRIAADLHFFVKNIIINECRYGFANFVVSKFYLGGISSSPLTFAEKSRVMEELIPSRVLIDYQGLSIEGVALLKQLSRYTGFKKMIFGMIRFMICCYSFFKSASK